jgi:enterochelin esterase family protein
MKQGTVRIDRHTSDCLRNNPLGDSHERKLVIYLPPGYHDHPEQRYPVIYLLSGFMGFGAMYLSPQAWGYSMDERCDRLIHEGRMREVIVVMPDCFTKYGGAQYRNSTALGNYEDYLIREIIPYVDRQYRTLPDKRHRGIMGKSSGGYAALVLCMSYPKLFDACYCSSGDMYFDYAYLPDIPKCYNALFSNGGLKSFLDKFFEAPKKTSEMITAINIIAMSAAYSPNPANAPFGFDLPFDEKTGERRQDIWSVWKQYDPVTMIDQDVYQQALKQIRGLYLDCGSRDEYYLHIGARIFTKKLKIFGIPLHYEEFNDGHMSTSYRYDVALSSISSIIQ